MKPRSSAPTPLAAAPEAPRPEPRRAAPERALPHKRRLSAHAWTALGLTFLAGCPWVSGSESQQEAGTAERLARLVELCTDLDPTLTTDFHDDHLRAQRKLVAELREEDPAFGRAALAEYERRAAPEEPVLVRVRLLEVAAHAAPEDTEPLLVKHIREYGHPMDIRTESVRLLAETRPQRALEVLHPYVTRKRAKETTPDDEFFVRAWVTACDATGRSPVTELLDVATNIYKQPIARYYAAEQLGTHPEPQGIEALRALLIESTGDGLLRRKAAQALRKALPRETACAILQEVASNEAELTMLEFLANMIQDLCE